jgi:DNA-binding SARP family transcriptional activator
VAALAAAGRLTGRGSANTHYPELATDPTEPAPGPATATGAHDHDPAPPVLHGPDDPTTAQHHQHTDPGDPHPHQSTAHPSGGNTASGAPAAATAPPVTPERHATPPDSTTTGPDTEPSASDLAAAVPWPTAGPPPGRPRGTRGPAVAVVPIGERDDGAALTLAVAGAPGIAILGDAAAAVARALLVTTLAGSQSTPRGGAAVLIIQHDAAELLGDCRQPGGLHIVPTLAALLAELHQARQHRADTTDTTAGGHHPLMLAILTQPAPPAARAQLARLLHDGHRHNLAAVILGDTSATTALWLAAPHTVTATRGPTVGHLHGARLYCLTVGHAHAALAQLAATPPRPDIPDIADWAPVAEPDPPPATSSDPHGVHLDPPPTPTDTDTPEVGVADSGRDPHTPGEDSAEAREDDTEARDDTGTRDDIGAAAISAVLDPLPPQPDEQHQPRRGVGGGPETTTGPGGLRLDILGPIRLTWTSPPPDTDGHDQSSTTREIPITGRVRELLTYLAVEYRGARRDTIAHAIWPEENDQDALTNKINTVISRARSLITEATGITGDIISKPEQGMCRLDPSLIKVDYWQLTNALHHRTGEDNHTEQIQALALCQGPLAEQIDNLWIDPPRQKLTRDVIDTATTLARTLARHDPRAALALLDAALDVDPHEETTYARIMEIQLTILRRPDAAKRTYQLCRTRLAEIDTQPTPAITQLLNPTHE